MSNVWFAIPSAREDGGTLQKWFDAGYKIAVWRDQIDPIWRNAHIAIKGEYPGYAQAVNRLVALILKKDPACEWIVTGGDDTEPDPNHSPDEIAQQCSEYFADHGPVIISGNSIVSTFGVMQPTGDRFANGSIDRICGSPWLGREFCERMYGGEGPLYREYVHMFVDEELQCVAQKLGVLLQRRDLIHLHRHFTRESDSLDAPATNWKNRPKFLDEANSREHWLKYEALFKARRAAGFPGHEPMACGGIVPQGIPRLVGE